MEESDMAQRANVMPDDGLGRVIERLSRGTRGRAANTAIRKWAGGSKRRVACARMNALCSRLSTVETDRFVRSTGEEREQRLP